MNKELEQCLTQFINKALDIANKGIDTAGEQIPLILQEIVYWQLVYGASCLVLGLILFIATIYGIKRSFCLLKQASSDDIDIYWIAGISLSLLSFVSSILSIGSIEEGFVFFKALVAPRLVIIEHLKGLL